MQCSLSGYFHSLVLGSPVLVYGRFFYYKTNYNMKVLAKGRIAKTTTTTKVLYTGTVLKAGVRGLDNSEVTLEQGWQVEVVAIDKEQDTVTVINPIDPERVLVIAAEAVELYNEAVGVWQTIVAVAKKIGNFFTRIFGKKK